MKRRNESCAGRKRKKPSFDSIVLLESKAERAKSDQKVGRRLSIATQAEVGIDENDDEAVIPCAQSKEIVEKSCQDHRETDEDLFNYDTSIENEDRNISRSPSPIPSFVFPNETSTKEKRLSCSLDWATDDSLLLKCASDFLKVDSNANIRTDAKLPVSTVGKELDKSSHNTADDNPKNDSIFGDADLSLIENMCHDKISKTNLISNVSITHSKSKDLPHSPIPAITSHFNPEKPIAASTPRRLEPNGEKLIHKVRERLKANAKQQTSMSIHLRESIRNASVQEEAKIWEDEVTTQDKGPFYGLPDEVQSLMFKFRGISKLYDWQHKCLTLKSVINGRNLIYSLPTSGGKTLVAEILIMKEILCKAKDAILVVPFVAIVQEKVRSIAQFADALDFLVEEYAGSKGRIPPTKRRKRKSLFICTIEKANTLVNSLIEVGRLESVGMVVVDELHMLGEGGKRGATIEMMLAKVLHMSKTTQIIGMSATLSNISELSKFLNAEVYTNDFRPVALDEYVKAEESIYRVQAAKLDPSERLEFIRVIQHANKQMASRDTDHLASLVLEVIPDFSCLIFCPTKKNCENVATMICKFLPQSLQEKYSKEKRAILDTWYQDSGGSGICPTLMKTIPFGIAYHHSGLTSDERKLIEDAYSDGVLCVIVCTSTLAAGVNLPARRVIIRSPYVARNFLSRSQYKQMIGRAGRAGIDTKGESFLIVTKPQDKQKVLDLVSGPVETCLSSLLYDGGKGFKTLILNLIGLKIMSKLSDVKNFFSCTLISVQLNTKPEKFSDIDVSKDNTEQHSLVESITRKALQELLDLKLIKLGRLKEDHTKEETENLADFSLEATHLGMATNRGSIDLSISNIVYDNLKSGLQNLVLSNYLHLLYLVTPHDAAENVKPNWMTYFQEYGNLTPDEQNASAVIGVPENYIALKAAGHRSRNKKVKDEIVSRFYVTLMLYSLFRGQTVWDVAARFEQPRGNLQALMSSSAAFASCVLHFTKEFEEFWPYHSLLEKLIQSLQYCATSELIPLMEIPGVKLARAKQLFTAGYKTLAHIAKADANSLVKDIEHLHRKQSLQLIASAKVLLKEKIEDLQAEVIELQTIPQIA